MNVFWLRFITICAWAVIGLINLCGDHVSKFQYGIAWLLTLLYMIISLLGA